MSSQALLQCLTSKLQHIIVDTKFISLLHQTKYKADAMHCSEYWSRK